MAVETATNVEAEELWGVSHPSGYPCISLHPLGGNRNQKHQSRTED